MTSIISNILPSLTQQYETQQFKLHGGPLQENADVMLIIPDHAFQVTRAYSSKVSIGRKEMFIWQHFIQTMISFTIQQFQPLSLVDHH